MNNKILHTPDGVQDVYGEACAQKLELESRLHQVLHTYGYQDIETPTFEYFDVFGNEVGTIPSKDLYKFFDREGNTLVLRPDFTPSVARAASRYLTEEGHTVRLCYLGNTFVNNAGYQGRLRENTQMGAEFIGDSSANADAEMIAIVVEALKSTGLTEFQVSIGQTQFFNMLAEEAGLDQTTRDELCHLLHNKNSFGIEKLLADASTDDRMKEILSRLPFLFGGGEVLEKARKLTQGMQACRALDRLQEVLDILRIYGLERYISFDLGMLSNYQYYTGIIFRAYTYGTGEAIVKGGRYDSLLGYFGKQAPSIGFVIVVNQLMNALQRQNISLSADMGHMRITYHPDKRDEAIRLAAAYRSQGLAVEMERSNTSDQTEEAVRVERID